MHSLEDLRSGRLKGARRVSLRLGLTEFPSELFSLADTLEELDLSDNHLSCLPPDFGRFARLRAAFFFSNQFTSIPRELSDCPQLDTFGFRYNQITQVDRAALPVHLRWLILTGNRLTRLPEGLGRLQRLQKLMLSGNALETLPPDLGDCRRLELIRLAANQLQHLPEWLVRMPSLAWLAFSSNRLDVLPPTAPALRICAQDVALCEVLGEGTSGIISRGIWQQGSGAPLEVAVKVFKKSLTSDGTPQDELQTWLAAGRHPHMVSVLGELQDHPEGARALVLDLIPSRFKVMAGPPSLTTCTRDTYPEGRRYEASQIENMAQCVAGAATHLHERGLLHGDLYPHNTFMDKRGTSMIGDFGAASAYDRSHPYLGKGLEQLEVRAFGCFLDDTLSRLAAEDEARGDKLRALRDRCMSQDVRERPLFSEIVKSIG